MASFHDTYTLKMNGLNCDGCKKELVGALIKVRSVERLASPYRVLTTASRHTPEHSCPLTAWSLLLG